LERKGFSLNQSYAEKKELIALLIGKKPDYAEILRFYGKIFELHATASPRLYLRLPNVEKPIMDIRGKEGFPLIGREEFLIDVPSSTALFEAICTASKHANEKMRTNIQILEEAFSINALRLEDLLKHHADDTYLDLIIRDFAIDKAILKFLIHMSIYPSLHAHAEMLKDQINLKQWLRGYCPICGSPPLMSQFNAEGQREYLCSFCGFEWPGERLKCPFCENSDHTKLHYFYAEGDEAYRVDICDSCNQYIKTVDSRKLDYKPDLGLDDIVTIHLDILASEKGFKRPVASPWGI
jgi:FdhE protein